MRNSSSLIQFAISVLAKPGVRSSRHSLRCFAVPNPEVYSASSPVRAGVKTSILMVYRLVNIRGNIRGGVVFLSLIVLNTSVHHVKLKDNHTLHLGFPAEILFEHNWFWGPGIIGIFWLFQKTAEMYREGTEKVVSARRLTGPLRLLREVFRVEQQDENSRSLQLQDKQPAASLR